MQVRPWVTQFAGRIPDPVIRLRFLQAVAPLHIVDRPRRKRRSALRWLSVLLCLGLSVSFAWRRAPARSMATPASRPRPAVAPAPKVEQSPAPVWLVEGSAASETYSNGLYIDNRFTVSNHARSYRAFRARDAGSAGVPGNKPAGIVFHTTESRQAPFEPGQNRILQRLGASLLEYVRDRRAYNFLIDRFGRVYRIVAESDAANHAGHSVWSDGDWIYVNLNESFLGVSIEAETRPGQVHAEASPAQLRSLGMLTEMLRTRYGIAARDCVTHAQVSVNPENGRVGYHTDWASSFPFSEVGLPDNYAAPLPAISLFGFEADTVFRQKAGDRLAMAADTAEEEVIGQAAHRGLSLSAYRNELRNRYRSVMAHRQRQIEDVSVE
jgi:hypothetical protein